MNEWYAIQVMKGREELMAEHISRVVPASTLAECFYPKYETEIKVRGSWVVVEKPLFPGYLIAVSSKPQQLDRALIDMQGFTRVLRRGDDYVPLAHDERDLIDSFTKPGKRTVPMSMGFKDGDAVVVTSGPLVGRQGLIKSINRRKSLAFLELDLCGRKVSTRVGLGILSAPETPLAARAEMYVEQSRKTA